MYHKILNVLIVDDELPIRQELEVFPWEEYGCINIATATNGREALEFCRGFCPDIVITDITMPVMDGIELIRHLKEELPRIKIVLLTCHRDFVYAREALKLGAVDYLIKIDISNEKIGEVLDNTRLLIEKDSLINRSMQDIKRTQLSKVFAKYNDTSCQSVELDEQEIFTSILNEDIECYFMLIDYNVSQWLFLQIELQEYINSQPKIKDWIPLGNGFYGIFIKNEINAMDTFIDNINVSINKNVFMNLHTDDIYFVKIKHTKDFIEYIDQMKMENVFRAHHFYNPSLKIINIDELNSVNDVDMKIKEEFNSLFLKNNCSTQEILENEFAQWAMEKNSFPNIIKEFATEFIRHNTLNTNDRQSVIPQIWAVDKLSELMNLVKQEIKLGQCNSFRIEIRKAIEIMSNEYGNPISLSYVAEKVNLSSQYLSKLFSEEVGKSFNDFLTGIRITNAQILINETDYRVYEIAEKVGIPNYRYFSSLFKKLTGLNPSNMKKTNSKGR